MPLPTSDHTELRTATRDVLAHHCTPAQVRARAESDDTFDADLWKIGAELGWNALSIPEEFDGIGLSITEVSIVAEEFGRAAQASPLPTTLGAALILDVFGSGYLRQRWLPLVSEGTAVLTWATGRGAARPVPPLTLRESDSGYLLDGFTDWLPHGTSATGFLVVAVLDEREVAVQLAATDEGVEVLPMQSLDFGQQHGRLQCSGVVVPAEAVMGTDAADAIFDVAVTLQCAETVGLASALLNATVEYTKSRVQFGRPIGSFQALKHKMSDMLMQCETARATTWEAASALSESLIGASEAVSVAKSITGRAGSSVASEALQLHGGIGFTWEHNLHLSLRRAKVNELLLGAPVWHEERLASVVRSRMAASPVNVGV